MFLEHAHSSSPFKNPWARPKSKKHTLFFSFFNLLFFYLKIGTLWWWRISNFLCMINKKMWRNGRFWTVKFFMHKSRQTCSEIRGGSFSVFNDSSHNVWNFWHFLGGFPRYDFKSIFHLAVFEHEIFFTLQFAYFILSIFEDTLYNMVLNWIDKFENRFVGKNIKNKTTTCYQSYR